MGIAPPRSGGIWDRQVTLDALKNGCQMETRRVIFSDNEQRVSFITGTKRIGSFRFHETILSFGEPGSLGILACWGDMLTWKSAKDWWYRPCDIGGASLGRQE